MAAFITLSALASLGLAGKLNCLLIVDRIRNWTNNLGEGMHGGEKLSGFTVGELLKQLDEW